MLEVVFGKIGSVVSIKDEELLTVTSCSPGLYAARVSLLVKLPNSPEVELVLISSADGKVLVVFNGKVSVVFVASSSVSIEGDDPCVAFDTLVLFACESEVTVGTPV